MPPQLVLNKSPTWDDLGTLLKKGFELNKKRVVIECEDPDFPSRVQLNEFVHTPNGHCPMNDVLKSLLESYGLPKGTFYMEPISDRAQSFLPRLVYEPEIDNIAQ